MTALQRLKIIGIGCGFVIWLLGVYVLWGFTNGMAEQVRWRPRDRAHLAVVDGGYSSHGIILHVRAPAGVAEVWKQKAGLRDRWSWPPWHPQHHTVPFFVSQTGKNGEVTVLVEYPFRPRTEWGLWIRSQDGYWTSESPYFPEAPDVSDKEWARLVAGARRVEPVAR